MSEISAMHVTNESESINPATGEVIARIPLNSVDDLIGKINSARSAQKQWAALPAKNRVQHIKKIQQYLLDHSDELSEIISANNGKLKIDALATEIFPAAIAVNYFCNKAKYFLKDKKLKPATWLLFFKRSKIVHVPYGVVGIVSPWNYPFSIPFLEIIPGLLAGNAVILKVASETQTIGIALKKCIEAAALPEGVFSYVNMSGRLATDTMLENGINKLFFTGSVEVGKSLMKKASETLTPLSLELGGNDAMIVCEDADLERAAMGACWAGFQNCGQSCGGVERLYVHENVYKQFLHLLKTKVELIRVNPDQDFNSEMGVMTTEKQVASVNKHIDDAIKKGAKLFAQSSFPEVNSCKNIMPAMVFTNVDHTMKMMREETFGPVIGVMKFKNNDEANELLHKQYRDGWKL